MKTSSEDLLEEVRSGSADVDAALKRLKHLPFEDLGFARIDHHRALRHGMPEVVFGLGKTTEQVVAIASKLLERSAGNVLITRATPAMAEEVARQLPGGEYFPPPAPFASGATRPSPAKALSQSFPPARATFPSPKKRWSPPRPWVTMSTPSMTSA